jgi:hypothetical protein
MANTQKTATFQAAAILRQHTNNEQGFVLVYSLLIMMLLTIIGIAATTNTIMELQISGNDRTYKETFYQADGGTRLAIRLIEESLGSPGGFTALDGDDRLVDPDDPNDTILIVDTTLSENAAGRTVADVSSTTRDVAYFPNGYDPLTPAAIPHTNIITDGVTGPTEGSGLQSLAGYEGMGFGAAGGGVQIVYTIFSQHMGRNNSQTTVSVDWRHVVGLELEGRY